jgi:hypothetical protein
MSEISPLKSSMRDTKEKLTTMTTQTVEEILSKKAEGHERGTGSQGDPPETDGGMENCTTQ